MSLKERKALGTPSGEFEELGDCLIRLINDKRAKLDANRIKELEEQVKALKNNNTKKCYRCQNSSYLCCTICCKIYCAECGEKGYSSCYFCDNSICKECQPVCPSCNGHCCLSCIKNCEKCIKKLCPNCYAGPHWDCYKN